MGLSSSKVVPNQFRTDTNHIRLVRESMHYFKMQRHEALQIRRLFEMADLDGSETIGVSEFHKIFSPGARDRDYTFLDRLWKVTKVKDELSWVQFFNIICWFCTLTANEILRFAFATFDVNGDGVITFDELIEIRDHLWPARELKSMPLILRRMKPTRIPFDRGDKGFLDAYEFLTLLRSSVDILWPLYRLQYYMRGITLGIDWWKIRERKREDKQFMTLIQLWVFSCLPSSPNQDAPMCQKAFELPSIPLHKLKDTTIYDTIITNLEVSRGIELIKKKRAFDAIGESKMKALTKKRRMQRKALRRKVLLESSESESEESGADADGEGNMKKKKVRLTKREKIEKDKKELHARRDKAKRDKNREEKEKQKIRDKRITIKNVLSPRARRHIRAARKQSVMMQNAKKHPLTRDEKLQKEEEEAAEKDKKANALKIEKAKLLKGNSVALTSALVNAEAVAAIKRMSIAQPGARKRSL